MTTEYTEQDEFADAMKTIASIVQATEPDAPTTPEPLPLGTRVIFSHQLYRHTYAGNYEVRKEWEPHPYYADAAKARGGIVVGKRTLSNGCRVWQGDEDGGMYEFIPDEHFTAYLVAFDLHRKPVHVRPEHITPEVVSTR